VGHGVVDDDLLALDEGLLLEDDRAIVCASF
jgi:hypothetical protein